MGPRGSVVIAIAVRPAACQHAWHDLFTRSDQFGKNEYIHPLVIVNKEIKISLITLSCFLSFKMLQAQIEGGNWYVERKRAAPKPPESLGRKEKQ